MPYERKNTLSSLIQKRIGWFLPIDNINNIFDQSPDDLSDLLCEDYDYSSNLFNKIKLSETIFREISDLRFVGGNVTSGNFKNIFNTIYHFDTFEGVLFQTPTLFLANRIGDVMDYYDSSYCNDINVKYLNCNIHFYKHYLNNNGPTTLPCFKTAAQGFAKKNNEENLIPVCDGIIWTFMLLSGFMKKSVDYRDFCINVRPAIITYW